MPLVPALAQQRSAKRGVCWDEKTQTLTDATLSKMSPGIAWLYTWGETPVGQTSLLDADGGIAFLPMTWNGDFDEAKLRAYLSAHPGARYLLAFNEPNLSGSVGGSAMTPQQAATAWPKVKQLAADFHLQLVAPALNFTGDNVGGRIWEPFAWYDEFFRLCPDAGVDFLAFHTYMNYYSAVDWVASRYFYSDADDADLLTAANRAQYPHLVAYLEAYQAANGHYPKMFLTEFCSYQGNEYPYTSAITLDFQIDQMTQKVQLLEQSELVEGYAWFMANPAGGETAWPYMSLFQRNTSDSELSALGTVYVYMSSFDTSKYYQPGELIQASDYVNATTGEQAVRLRPNSDAASSCPLQVELVASAYTTYLVELAEAGTYVLTLRAKSAATNTIGIYGDNFQRLLREEVPSTGGQWKEVTLTLSLPAGKSELTVVSAQPSFFINGLRLSAVTDGIDAPRSEAAPQACYTLGGQRVGGTRRPGIYVQQGRKVVVR